VTRIAEHAPFADAGRVYVLMLRSAPDGATRQRILDLASDLDLLAVHERELYWRPTRFGESPVGGALGKIVGAESTMRNTSTMRRLAAFFAAQPQVARPSRKVSGSVSTVNP
jgi:hypothetical protein